MSRGGGGECPVETGTFVPMMKCRTQRIGFILGSLLLKAGASTYGFSVHAFLYSANVYERVQFWVFGVYYQSK